MAKTKTKTKTAAKAMKIAKVMRVAKTAKAMKMDAARAGVHPDGGGVVNGFGG